MKINITGVVSGLVTMLYEEWNNLKAEYGVNFPFVLSSTGKFIELCAETYVNDSVDDMMKFVKECDVIKGSGFMCTMWRPLETPDGKTAVMCSVHMVNETFFNACLEYFHDMDILERFLKMSLRHEMGHCLVFKETFEGVDFKNIPDMVKKYDEDHKNAIKETGFDSCKDPFEKDRIYHNLPREKEADERVGLTADDFMSIFIEHSKRWPYIDINVSKEERS